MHLTKKLDSKSRISEYLNIFQTNNSFNEYNNEFVNKVVTNYNNFSNQWINPNFIEQNFGRTKIIFIDDTVQEVGAFKIRGATTAINNVLEIDSRIKSIVVASSGSFGISVANVCKKRKLNSLIYIPNNTPKLKKEKIMSYDSKINENNEYYDEAKENAKKYAAQKKEFYYLDGCREDIFWGNGSLILELIKEYSNKESNFFEKKIAMVLPLGVGSLATPCTILLKHYFKNATIIIAEPLNYCKFYYTFDSTYKPSFDKTIADGAAVKKLPDLSYNILKKTVDYVSINNEKEIIGAMKYLYTHFQIKSEGAGALPTASFIYNKNFFKSYDYVLIPICGKNIHDEVFKKLLN